MSLREALAAVSYTHLGIPDELALGRINARSNIVPRLAIEVLEPYRMRTRISGGPTQHNIGALEDTAIVVGKSRQPEVGCALAGLHRPAIRA